PASPPGLVPRAAADPTIDRRPRWHPGSPRSGGRPGSRAGRASDRAPARRLPHHLEPLLSPIMPIGSWIGLSNDGTLSCMEGSPSVSSAWRQLEAVVLGSVGVAAFSLTLPATKLALHGLAPVFVSLGRALVAA